MTFQELVNEVLIIIKRPDLTERVKSAVRAATLKLHHSDFFYKDLWEVPVQFEEELYLQNFNPNDITTRFRKAKYVRYWIGGSADGTPGVFLTPIQIENSNDAYGCIKNNVFYMAGQLLQIRTMPAVKHVLFGCYLNPIVTPETSYDSWIAREYPWAIIYESCRTIYRSISMAEESNNFAQLTGEILNEIKMSCVDDLPLT